MIDELTYMLNMGDFSVWERNEMECNKIDFKKKLSKLLKESRGAAKAEKCYYCGKDITGFCNSHSIPAFCLKNIAVAGEVATTNLLVDIPLIDNKKGVKQAGTFQIICDKCDNEIFADYENPNNYKYEPSNKMLAQIALKNYLNSISKRLVENEMYKYMYDEFNLPKELKEAKQSANNLDLNEYINGFNKAKRSIQKNWNDEYYLCYYEKLSYTVPIAFQSNISMIVGFDGEIINDVYNPSADYKIKPIHICVFPLKNSSVIMMFVDNGDKRYRRFYKKFNMFSLEDKLQILTYIMFAYSEDVFFSKTISKEVKASSELVKVSQQGQDVFSLMPIFNAIEIAKENFALEHRKKIPNLLSEKYKLNIE